MRWRSTVKKYIRATTQTLGENRKEGQCLAINQFTYVHCLQTGKHMYTARSRVTPLNVFIYSLFSSFSPVSSHWRDLLDSNRGVVADAVDGRANHPVRSLPDRLQVVVTLGDLGELKPRTTRTYAFIPRPKQRRRNGNERKHGCDNGNNNNDGRQQTS